MHWLDAPPELQAEIRKAITTDDGGAAFQSLMAAHPEVEWLPTLLIQSVPGMLRWWKQRWDIAI
jgi:hypothetical protein